MEYPSTVENKKALEMQPIRLKVAEGVWQRGWKAIQYDEEMDRYLVMPDYENYPALKPDRQDRQWVKADDVAPL